jgi:prepilin-type N-terminal cleavage/methylation domain-containing protein
MTRPTRRSVPVERGFTLVEVAIALAIGAFILAAFTVVFSQSLGTSRSNNSRVTAIRNVDVAGAWFVRDFQAAQSVPATAILTAGSSGITVVQSVDNTSDSSVRYAISLGKDLLRTTGVTTSMIAQNIARVEYRQGSGLAPSTANITATINSATISKVYNLGSRISDVTYAGP